MLSPSKPNAKLFPIVNGTPKQQQRYDLSLPQTSHSPTPLSREQRNNDMNSIGSASIRSKTPQLVLDSFGVDHDVSDEDIVEYSGPCYLKTKTESYKKHFMVLSGNELRFFKKEGDTEHKVMHCLAGTYLKEVTMDEVSEKSKSSASK